MNFTVIYKSCLLEISQGDCFCISGFHVNNKTKYLYFPDVQISDIFYWTLMSLPVSVSLSE